MKRRFHCILAYSPPSAKNIAETVHCNFGRRFGDLNRGVMEYHMVIMNACLISFHMVLAFLVLRTILVVIRISFFKFLKSSVKQEGQSLEKVF